ncbi:hypothetical protein ACROYT_G013747 [Oculina patagonica]
MTGGDGGERTGCAGGASSDDESVPSLINGLLLQMEPDSNLRFSRAERPCERMCVLRVAVATDRVTGDTGPPSGSCRSNSFSTS